MIKDIWKDSVWSRVIAAVIIALLGSLGAYLLGLLPWIISAFTQLWKFVISSTSVPNWLIGVMIILCTLFVWGLLCGLRSKLFQKPTTSIGWKSYRQDNFFGLLWVWSYSENRIVQLYSLCPECNYRIIPRDISSFDVVPLIKYTCEDCGYSVKPFECNSHDLLNKVKLKIEKEIRNGTWEQKVK